MARRLSSKAASGGLRELLIADRQRSSARWALPSGAPDEWLEDLRAGCSVVVSSGQLMKALAHGGLPCAQFCYGGADQGKVFVLDEGGELREVAG